MSTSAPVTSTPEKHKRYVLFVLCFVFCLFSVFCFLCFAEDNNRDSFQIKLHQGKYLTSIGEWDLAEAKLLQVLESPRVEDRIRAGEGLVRIYQTLRLDQKAKRAQEELNREIEFQRKLVPKWDSYYADYEIKKGDTYSKLAMRDGISLEWLVKVNQGKLLIEGDTIRLPKIHYSLTVDKSKKSITWFRGSEIIKIYPIAVGREGMETPEGEFVIINKVENPVWYKMKKTYPPESPDNLLGTRWLGLDRKGYGIHGTRDPNSIGSAASHGCIRMHNHDVEELFQWIPVGTKVTIR
jgi:hypothetical protein